MRTITIWIDKVDLLCDVLAGLTKAGLAYKVAADDTKFTITVTGY